ncbi:unnamed protein product [Brachionus calyciflorus]|uniref:CCAAT-binding factor domain-containing protein n=1 Tax=Brachionus calyciflorus TaxID=104777 RepID=A0A814NC30_9BILA|nr:unnamed protein product [Brachionus calyciflorus]
MFLLSTHFSSVIVGTFIKKLSRMTLTCPPADLKFLIMFIYNLLIRHPNFEKLTSLSQTIEFPLDDAFENNSYEFLIEIELDSNKATANCAINYSICLDEKDREFFDRNVSNLVRINKKIFE